MDVLEGGASSDGVLEVEDLVIEILLRLGCTQSVLRSSIASKIWLAAARNRDFGPRYIERYKPVFLGFLVEFSTACALPRWGRRFKLVPAQDGSCGDTATLIAGIDAHRLSAEDVLSSRNGVLLFFAPNTGYYTRCPWDSHGRSIHVGSPIPPLPHPTDGSGVNTLGQFGCIPNAGTSGMAFFQKDVPGSGSGCLERSYRGVTFNSTCGIYVHVCIYLDGERHRHFSSPIPSLSKVMFQRNPYCILSGDLLYMMYVVGFIVCFDTITHAFTLIPLPGNMAETVDSWFDYTVGEQVPGGVAVVHFFRGTLFKWLLKNNGDGLSWTNVARLNLVEALGSRFGLEIWDRVIGIVFRSWSMDWYSVQVRSVSAEGRLVFIIVGFHNGLYVADMELKIVREITNVLQDGRLGLAFPLSEVWRPNP